MAITLYEHTVYLLRIQLDCASQLNRELFENGCNLAQDVNVWIDINGDGQFDKSEIGAPYRWPVTSYMAHGIYDLQIYIPIINDNYIRTRQHRMRIVVMQNENYQRTCGRTDYNETRDYTVNIVPRIRHLGKYYSIYSSTLSVTMLDEKKIKICFILIIYIQTVPITNSLKKQ
jgi:hypothetical protein